MTFARDHRRSVLLALLAVLAVIAVLLTPPTAKAAATGASFVPLSAPTRLADSRSNLGGAGTTPLGAGQTRSIVVAGRAGVPVNDVVAVLVDIDVVSPSSNTHLTLYPSGSALPETASVVAPAGVNASNSAVVALGANGAINVFGSGGPEHFIIDVQGYFTRAEVAAAGGFMSVAGERFLDTRDGTGAGGSTAQVPPNSSITVQIAGLQSVPLQANSVFANLTVLNATAAGFLVAHPAGAPRPGTSSVGYPAGSAVSGSTSIRLGNGAVTVYNSGPSAVHLTLDVQGYFVNQIDAGGFTVTAARLLDSRQSTALAAGETRVLPVAGRAGVPVQDSEVTILASFAAINPAAAGSLIAFPAGEATPSLPTVSYPNNGTVRSNLSAVVLGPDGAIALENRSTGVVHVTVDLQGFFTVPVEDSETEASDPQPVYPSDALTYDVPALPPAELPDFDDLSLFQEATLGEDGVPTSLNTAAEPRANESSFSRCQSLPSAYDPKGKVLNHFNFCRVKNTGLVRRNFSGDEIGRTNFRITVVGRGSNNNSGDGKRRFFFDVLLDRVTFSGVGGDIKLTVFGNCERRTGSECRGGVTSSQRSMKQWQQNGLLRVDYTSARAGSSGNDFLSGYVTEIRYKTDRANAYTFLPTSTIRCDSASYIRTTRAGEGCVFNAVNSIFELGTQDTGVDESARHILQAQANPQSTSPQVENKQIDGSENSRRVLIRNYYDMTRRRQARDIAVANCQRDDSTYASRGLDCDEYPFNATFNDATGGPRFYSSKPIDKSDNRRVGARLGVFYTYGRILHSLDGYYVRIRQ